MTLLRMSPWRTPVLPHAEAKEPEVKAAAAAAHDALPRFLLARGAAVPESVRAPAEAGLGTSLAAARLHQGPEVTAGLQALSAPAAAIGRHVLLSGTAPQALLPAILRHELAHAAQARLADPDPGRPLRLGERGSALERQASAFERGRPGTPLRADANTVHRYDIGGADGLGMGEWQDWMAELEAEKQVWRGKVAERAPAEIATRPATIGDAIEQSKTSILMQRGAMFDALQRRQAVYQMIPWLWSWRPTVPADLLERWVEAEQAAISLDAAAADGPDATYLRALAHRYLLAFFSALAPVLEAHEQEQRERQAREKAEADAYNAQRELLLRERQRSPFTWAAVVAGGPMAGLHQIYLPPRDYYRAPAPTSPGVRKAEASLAGAPVVPDVAAALGDLAAATRAFDRMLIDRLGPRNEVAEAFTYQQGLLARQQEIAQRQPHGWVIPAVFYPELKYVDVTAPDGSAQKVAQGIPWQLYLHHTGFQGHERLATSGGEWVLEDLMAADKRPTNRMPSRDIDAAMLQQGAVVDPPWELFEQLDSSLRFPVGQLVVALPSGKRRTLETTEPTTLSGFLTKLGIALAAIGMVLLTGGAGTPAALAFIGAAAAGVGSTLAGMQEKAEQGLLTERDINQAIVFIAADILSAFSAGLGRIASVSARAAQAGRAASLIGRYVVPLTRAAQVSKVGALAGDVASAVVVSAELIRQAELIDRSNLSDDEKKKALGRLVLTGLLTVSLTTMSVAGNVKGRMRLDLDNAGRPLLRQADEAAEEAAETVAGRPTRQEQELLDSWLRFGSEGGAAVAGPPSARRLNAARRRFERGRPKRDDLETVIAGAVADMRALSVLEKSGLRPDDLAGACGLAKGQIPASVLSLLENSRVPIRVDAVSGTLLGAITGRTVEGAAHQFVIVRVADGPAFLVDPTFAQFLAPGSTSTRQFGADLATGLLDTPQGMRLAQDLVSKGYVPLTRDNLALYTRALGYDAGPVGGIMPGPAAEHLFSGQPHFSIVQFEAQGGVIRNLDLPQPAAGNRAAAEVEARGDMLSSMEHPGSIAEHARYMLDNLPPPTTPAGRAARARVEEMLRVLDDLASRYRGRIERLGYVSPFRSRRWSAARRAPRGAPARGSDGSADRRTPRAARGGWPGSSPARAQSPSSSGPCG